MQKHSRLTALVALAAALGIGACSDTDSSELTGGGGSSRLSLLLTDAPGDFEAAVVTISQVYLSGGSGGRVVLLDEPVTTDLLTLSNDVAELVEDFELPEGNYKELRFVLEGAYIEVEGANGQTKVYATPGYDEAPAQVDGTLRCPSCSSSGIKVKLPDNELELTEGDHAILVDFDVSESFGHQAGNSGQWIMHPVLKATAIQQSASVAVTLKLGTGITLPPLGGNAITLGAFSVELRSTSAAEGTPGEVVPFVVNANGEGVASFGFVVPGTYTLKVIGPAGLTFTPDPASPLTITVGSGATVAQTFTLTGATAGT